MFALLVARPLFAGKSQDVDAVFEASTGRQSAALL